MKTKKKALLLTLCAALLVAVSVLGTMAYLTADDQVINTFTVGTVSIKLDEAKANTDGSLVYKEDGKTPVDRVKANEYKLIPGHTYHKDPMVTVLKGSEKSYIKMTVTFSKARELDKLLPLTPDKITDVFVGYDSTNWTLVSNAKDAEKNTRTYEFRYKETVAAPEADVALDALFDQIKVPGEITKEELATIEGMTITVNAYAIQADGFADADAAWEAFSE